MRVCQDIRRQEAPTGEWGEGGVCRNNKGCGEQALSTAKIGGNPGGQAVFTGRMGGQEESTREWGGRQKLWEVGGPARSVGSVRGLGGTREAYMVCGGAWGETMDYF